MECETEKGGAASGPERSVGSVGQRSEESKLEATEQSARRGTQLNAPDAPDHSAIISRGNKPHFRHAITPGDSTPRLLLFPCLHTWPLSRTERGRSRGEIVPPPASGWHRNREGEAPPEPFNAEEEVKRN